MKELERFTDFIAKNKSEQFFSRLVDNLQSSTATANHFIPVNANLITPENSDALIAALHLTNGEKLFDYYIKLVNPQQYAGKHTKFTFNIFTLAALQKQSLISVIPLFTHDVETATIITAQLETIYTYVIRKVLLHFDTIQESELDRLEESEEKYRDLFDNASDMVHIVNPEGNILYVNKSWSITLGYSSEELQGHCIYEFVAEREKAHFMNYRADVIAGRSNEQIETCMITKDGREIFVEGSISCKYKDGKPEYTRGILRDISRRRADERTLLYYTEQLEEREQNMHQLIQNAPDAIIVIDEKSVIQLWNPKTEEIFGWKAEEVIGLPLSQTIIPLQYGEAHAKGMERLITTGEVRVLNKTIEITALNKSGYEFYISLTISRASQNGKPVFVSFLRDISEQKKNQLELQKKTAQLERTNEQLAQYAWLASHDLKEPLRKILTYTNLLSTRYTAQLPEDLQQKLGKINHAALRMDNLIEGILIYSNITEESELFKPVDLNIIVADVLSDLEISIAEKKAIISVEELPVIEAVPLQMSQLFQNLISNSIKYSRTDTIPKVNISTHYPENGWVEITVTDNGTGFEIKYVEKIFQVFQRLSNSKGMEGTGLGLALCKKITELHGGTIQAKSEPGLGSTFVILLPVSQK